MPGRTHGETTLVNGKRVVTLEYRSWQMMKNRCLNPKATDFHRYGGRGVVVCERWLSFENFLADMGRRPTPAHTLERDRGDDGYEPSNCRWATRTEQSRNREYAKQHSWELAEKLDTTPRLALAAIGNLRVQDATGIRQVSPEREAIIRAHLATL